MHLDIKISDLRFNSVVDHTHTIIMSMKNRITFFTVIFVLTKLANQAKINYNPHLFKEASVQ